MGAPLLKDLTGLKYGMLTVTGRAPNKGKHTMWACVCDCGNKVDRDGHKIQHQANMDCGCRALEKQRESSTKHGYASSPTYVMWVSLKARDRGDSRYSVCSRWQKFENFLEDMGERPSGHYLTRLNVKKGFSPTNCSWVLPEEQFFNKMRKTLLRKDGITKTAKEWATEMGVLKRDFYINLSTGIYDKLFEFVKKTDST